MSNYGLAFLFSLSDDASVMCLSFVVTVSIFLLFLRRVK